MKRPKVRKAGSCRWCGHTSGVWPILRRNGRQGSRVVCCAACSGPNPLDRPKREAA